MYHAIIRAKLRTLIGAINRGDFAYVVRQFAPGAEHGFAGEGHALAGTRHSSERISAWYARLHKLFPDMRFEVERITVGGWPWHTCATIEVHETSSDRKGTPFSNEVVLLIEIQWARATRLRVCCDTEVLKRNLATLQDQGVTEAGMSPIV